MADLARILSLREKRCTALRRAEKVASSQALAARERVKSIQQSIDEYAAEVRTLEIDLLAELVRTELKKNDFDAFHEKLAAAEQHARRLAERLQEAKKSLSEAVHQFKKARQDRREMEAKTNRIAQVQNDIAQEAATAQTVANDAEMDEIAEVLSGRRE